MNVADMNNDQLEKAAKGIIQALEMETWNKMDIRNLKGCVEEMCRRLKGGT